MRWLVTGPGDAVERRFWRGRPREGAAADTCVRCGDSPSPIGAPVEGNSVATLVVRDGASVTG